MSWSELADDRIRELYLAPERFTLPAIAAKMTDEFRSPFSLRMIQSKIMRLGIKNRANPLIWASPRDTRLAELYKRADAPSYTVMRDAINREFGTTFSRCAIASKIDQMNLRGRDLPTGRSLSVYTPRPSKPRADKVKKESPRHPSPPPAVVKLHCVEIVPRHLTLLDLERGDCRFPYGGDAINEPITFCGHPKMAGSPYCTPHFHLCRGQRPATTPRASFTIGKVA